MFDKQWKNFQIISANLNNFLRLGCQDVPLFPHLHQQFSRFSIQRLSSIKGHLPSKNVFHQRLSFFKGCLSSKVVFNQSLSSINIVIVQLDLSWTLRLVWTTTTTPPPYHKLFSYFIISRLRAPWTWDKKYKILQSKIAEVGWLAVPGCLGRVTCSSRVTYSPKKTSKMKSLIHIQNFEFM